LDDFTVANSVGITSTGLTYCQTIEFGEITRVGRAAIRPS